MRLKNYTSIDTDWLRKATAAVKPANVTNFDISFKNCAHGNRGRAYTNGCSYHSTHAPLVVVALSKATKFPYRTVEGKGYLGITCYTLKEVAVLIIAHELRHLWQSKVKKGWRVWGAKGQYSERDADAYGLRMLRAYRRGELGF
jgi:hypothetical protein